MTPAILFARSDSDYKSLGVDVWDMERDARNYAGVCPVVAHPPCRAWGRLRALANPRPDEKALALFAVDTVRRVGGVLEHPAHSTLWAAKGLPLPGAEADKWGGWTLPVVQFWWGHRAMKATWLYIVGCAPAQMPEIPLVLGDSSCTVSSSGRRLDGSRLKVRPEISKREREATPLEFAKWLIQVANMCDRRAAS